MSLSSFSRSILLFFVCFLTCFLAFSQPDICRMAFSEALRLCREQLLPALFPFLVISGFLGDAALAGIVGKAFRWLLLLLRIHSPAAGCTVLLGIAGGFAPAAAALKQLYKQNALTQREIYRLLPLCITSSAAFTVLTVGNLLGSYSLGKILFTAQTVANVLCSVFLAILIKSNRSAQADAPALCQTNAADTIANASVTFVRLCSFVIFFRFLSGGIAAYLPDNAALGLTLLLELTSGCSAAAQSGPYAVYLCCAALSLQSISVWMQVRMLLPKEISLWPLLATRPLHLAVSLGVTHILLRLFPPQSVYNSLETDIRLRTAAAPDILFVVFFGLCQLVTALSCIINWKKRKSMVQ